MVSPCTCSTETLKRVFHAVTRTDDKAIHQSALRCGNHYHLGPSECQAREWLVPRLDFIFRTSFVVLPHTRHAQLDRATTITVVFLPTMPRVMPSQSAHSIGNVGPGVSTTSWYTPRVPKQGLFSSANLTRLPSDGAQPDEEQIQTTVSVRPSPLMDAPTFLSASPDD
jgi:hypothetical protein